MISYILVGFSNPGIAKPSPNNNMEINGQTVTSETYFCRKCNVVKNKDTKHCQDCDCCILEFDHHCPWIGKCVGKENKIRFFAFVGMIFLVFVEIFLFSIIYKF